MARPKKSFPLLLGTVALALFLVAQPALASSNNYYDFGPYYNQPQVLGFSFSNLENLPALTIPDNLSLPEARGILPDSPFYPFERFVENTQIIFTFDPVKREEFRLNIAEERLSEAKTLLDRGKTGAATKAFDDYGKTLTAITNNLPNIAQSNTPEAKQLLDKTEEMAAAQTVVATALSLATSPAQAAGWSEAAETGRQVLDKVAEIKGEGTIPEDLSKDLQQLKEEGFISEEESNKLYGLKNRGEVREELNKLTASGQLPPTGLVRLDEAIARRYPDIQNQQITNLEVVELRSYQTLPQPGSEIIENLQKWQEDPSVSPSNDIKPYLWYNRAQALARNVDLSNFSQVQQADLAKLYPGPVVENPTYSPPPSPTPSASPTTGADTTSVTTGAPTDQPSTPAAQSSAQPTSTPVPAGPYLQDPQGALPGQPTYIIKRWGELLSFTLTFDPVEKAKFRMQQAERRLAEAAVLSNDPQKAPQYEDALKNYQQALADASSRLKNLADSRDAVRLAQVLEAQAARHETVFEKGLLPPPTKNPALISDSIETAEDAMDRSADRLDRPALPPQLSYRLGDLKAQGLILTEEAQDVTNSNSREEVRAKIRKLVENNTFPPADAKKLDEAQFLSSPSDYNQLVEVRKVEELQNLRAVQTDLAQTPTLRQTATTLGQKEAALTGLIDTTLIKPEDLAGRDDLVKTYQKLASVPRPINLGQFGPEATPGAEVATPVRTDAVLSACPDGAIFKQFEGCVWADNGRRINDYDQYKCEGPRQYYSFAARKCIAYNNEVGFRDDVQPICPVGYTWNWQAQSCQTTTGGGSPFPTPSPEPEPIDENEIAERSKSCPEGSAYKVPRGCVWDQNDKPVYDSEQYRCGGRGQYYSFKEQKCVAAPKQGEPYPDDAAPACKEPGTYWSWSSGKCVPAEIPLPSPSGAPGPIIIDDIRPSFVTPDSPFYFLKQAGERIQQFTAFTPQARQRVSLDQAQERLAEAIDALKKDDEQGVKKALTAYTNTMQLLVGDISKAGLSEIAKNEVSKRLSQEAVEQNLLLEKLSAWAPAEQDTAIQAAVSVTILGVDKAADLAGEPAIPDEVKAKIEAMPAEMLPEEERKKLLEATSRVDARLGVGNLVAQGRLSSKDAAFLNEDFENVDSGVKLKIGELKKLEDIATTTDQKEKLVEKIEKNEGIVEKLQEFEKTFEPGQEIASEIRPYVRLTRINEITQTIRPDIVRLDQFQNRKDLSLAVATLQEEFRPTAQAMQQVEDFRRRNPSAALPPELARIEALSFSLGVRNQAGPCYLPNPPFPANTPCPPPGAAIPIASYYVPVGAGIGSATGYGSPTGYSGYYTSPGASTDKDGKPFVYGQGPTPTSAGICPDGYHWMYDSGGWCMSNSGSYSSSYTYTPSGTGSGYTPYSPYYNAPGAPPATYGYPVGDYSPNDGCPYGYDSDGRGNCVPNSYPPSSYSYSPPSYYGTAPTYYTTSPYPGSVPGSGPKPTAPGQCPSGYHWMSDSGGWCMADGPTYVPGGPPTSYYPTGTTTSSTPPEGGYNCGSQPYDPVTKRCKDGACPGGFNWDGSKCVAGGTYYSPNLTQSSCGPGYYWDGRGCIPTYSGPYSGNYTSSSYQYGCTPGYYWDGSKCVPGSNEGSGWSDTAARSQSWCQPPSGGCGYNSYWDYGSCYCRSSSTYYGGSGPSPSNQCQGLSCGGGAWLDYSTCSCRYSGGSGTSSTGSPITCYPPSAGCPGGWYDYGTCSCKTGSSTTYTNTGCANVSASSCGSGWYWDSAACTCRQSSTSTSTSGGSSSGSCPSGSHWMSDNGGYCMSDSSSTSSGGSTGSSSGSCPSGYHWMSENGGYCMQDGGGSTSSPPPASTPPPSTESTPPPSTSTPPPSESTPPPSTPSP